MTIFFTFILYFMNTDYIFAQSLNDCRYKLEKSVPLVVKNEFEFNKSRRFSKGSSKTSSAEPSVLDDVRKISEAITIGGNVTTSCDLTPYKPIKIINNLVDSKTPVDHLKIEKTDQIIVTKGCGWGRDEDRSKVYSATIEVKKKDGSLYFLEARVDGGLKSPNPGIKNLLFCFSHYMTANVENKNISNPNANDKVEGAAVNKSVAKSPSEIRDIQSTETPKVGVIR